MQKDSIDTLLLRHYGNTASVPVGLKEQLLASTRHEAAELRQQQQVITRLREKRVSRRHAVRLVAISTAGLSILSVGLEGLDAVLVGQDAAQRALP